MLTEHRASRATKSELEAREKSKLARAKAKRAGEHRGPAYDIGDIVQVRSITAQRWFEGKVRARQSITTDPMIPEGSICVAYNTGGSRRKKKWIKPQYFPEDLRLVKVLPIGEQQEKSEMKVDTEPSSRAAAEDISQNVVQKRSHLAMIGELEWTPKGWTLV